MWRLLSNVLRHFLLGFMSCLKYIKVSLRPIVIVIGLPTYTLANWFSCARFSTLSSEAQSVWCWILVMCCSSQWCYYRSYGTSVIYSRRTLLLCSGTYAHYHLFPAEWWPLMIRLMTSLCEVHSVVWSPTFILISTMRKKMVISSTYSSQSWYCYMDNTFFVWSHREKELGTFPDTSQWCSYADPVHHGGGGKSIGVLGCFSLRRVNMLGAQSI